MIHDQADELRQLVRERAPVSTADGPAASLVVVGGGKNGVGTSTVAMNLAVGLARQGRRAVLVDADLEHGGMLERASHRDAGSLDDVLTGRRSLHEVLARGPAGVQIVPGARLAHKAHENSPAAQARLISDLKHLGPHADVIVVDAGNGRGNFATRFWQAASAVWVVVAPDDEAVLQGYAAIKLLTAEHKSARFRTFVNRASETVAGEVHARIAEACRRFLRLPLAGGCSAAIDKTSNLASEVAFPAGSHAARAFDQAADLLWSDLQAGSEGNRGARAALSAC
jgi:flagellar biosynthesis protein FlhG